MDMNLSQAPNEPITQEEEVAETTPEEGSPQTQPQTEKPLTRSEIVALLQEVIPQQVEPLIQSRVDKGINRTQKAIGERLAALEREKSTLNLSDEQVAQAKKAIIEDETMKAYSPAQEPNPQGNGQEQQPFTEPIDPARMQFEMNTRAFQLAGGTEVTPQDKEWAMMEKVWNDPQGNPDLYIIAAVDASRTKAQRLAEQKKNASARVTNTGTEVTTGTPLANSSDDYWKKAHAKN